MAKMTNQDESFLRLLLRSPDTGSGWRMVSKPIWPLVLQFGSPELIEAEGNLRDGGRVRLTDRGAVVANYI